MKIKLRGFKGKLLIVLAALLLIYVLWAVLVSPSNYRNWSRDQALLSYAEILGDVVNLHNVRNFTYRNTTDYDVDYYNKSFDLASLDSLWFMVEPFSGHGLGAAHTLLSFGFGDEYVAISVEIRKEKGEKFSPLKGLFRNYELMYVIGDERDLIKLRSNYRKDTVYLYKINTTVKRMQLVFLDMLERANELRDEPEFYNTLTSTCTTNIVSHVNIIVPDRVPFSYKVLMPAYSDELAYDLGLIVTDDSFEETREYYRINDAALMYADYEDFSVKIREGL